MAGLVDGIDVASAGELKVALDAGADPAEVSFAGPGKRDAELRQAVAAGVLVNVESMRELPVLAAASQALGLPARVAMRVNPDFELKGSGMKMGGGAQAVRRRRRAGARRCCAGSAARAWPSRASTSSPARRTCAPNRSARRSGKSYELALRLAEHAPHAGALPEPGRRLRHPLLPGRAAAGPGADRRQPGGAAASAPRARCRRRSFVIELGRYLVGEAGIYVTRIVDRKVSRGQVFLVTDGGLHHHLAASGNFGQVVRKNYPVTIGNRVGSSRARDGRRWSGPLCTPLDLLADRMDLPVAAGRRPGGGVPVGRLRRQRQPAGLPGPPGLRRSAGLTSCTWLPLHGAPPHRTCRNRGGCPRGRRAGRRCGGHGLACTGATPGG